MHCFLLEGVAFGEAGLLVLSWWALCCCYNELITVPALLFFLILLFLAVCIRIASNWYLLDINICSLSKNQMEAISVW
jgi:hypothetical protein